MGFLLPNPPPVYGLMNTTCEASMPTKRAMAGTAFIKLCAEVWTKSFPFCQ